MLSKSQKNYTYHGKFLLQNYLHGKDVIIYVILSYILWSPACIDDLLIHFFAALYITMLLESLFLVASKRCDININHCTICYMLVII